jgi:ATP synthase protein I
MSRETAEDLDDFRPLSAEEAQALRARQPLLSVWRVVAFQALVCVVLALLLWWVADLRLAQSVAYGGLAVVIPSALFARGMTSRLTRASLGTAVAGFLLWELVKIGVTVAMLFMAQVWIKDVSWPAMLAGFVVTMKMHWVVIGLGRLIYPKVKT